MDNMMESIYLTARSLECLEKIDKILNDEHPQVIMSVAMRLMAIGLSPYDEDDWDDLMEINKRFSIEFARHYIEEKESG